MASDIDTWMVDRVLPEYQPIVKTIRAVVKQHIPEVEESMTNGTPAYPGNLAWRVKHIVALISPTKQGITIAFTKGGSFKDKYELLEGLGKSSLNYRLKSLDDLNEEALIDYFKQAVLLDT